MTWIPDLAVNKPTESTLVTSSYVNVPPIDTLPAKVASPVKVETPATEILSKFVWPSTSKSPFASILPVNVALPEFNVSVSVNPVISTPLVLVSNLSFPLPSHNITLLFQNFAIQLLLEISVNLASLTLKSI